MKKITSLIPVLFTLFGSGCASFGPTILIETEQPEEDFVVLCEWYKDGLLNIHGGMKRSDWKTYVTESGKKVDCGVSIWGGTLLPLLCTPFILVDIFVKKVAIQKLFS